MELLRIGIIRGFEELVRFIRYFVWSVLGENFITDLVLVRRKLGGSI